MTNKFIISVVCAITLHSLGILSSSTASGIHIGPELDFSIMQTYCAIATHQSEKVIQSISTQQHQAYFAQCKNSTEDNRYSSQSCEYELFAPWFDALDATLAAILVVDSEAHSAVATFRAIGNTAKTEFAQGICSAIVLALERNSSGDPAKIRAIADAQASEAAVFNAAFFTAIRNGRDMHPKFELAIQNAESKATPQFVTAICDIFMGIETLMSAGTQTESKDIFSTIEVMNNRAISGISADLKIKFELLQTFLTVSYVIQFGIFDYSSVVQSIKESAFSDYEKPVEENFSTCGNDESNDCVENQSDNQSEIMCGNCDSQTARETATLKLQIGIATVFRTIENELAKVHFMVKNKNECVNEADEIETAKEKTISAYNEAIDAVTNATLIANPKASVILQSGKDVAQSTLRKVIEMIYEAINLIRTKDSFRILTKLQAMEDATTRVFTGVIINIYDGFRRAIIDADSATIENAQKGSILQTEKVCQAVFDGIRLRMAEVIVGTRSETEGIISSIKALQSDASIAMKAVVQYSFDALQTLYEDSAGDQVDMVMDLDVIRSYGETAVSKVTEAIDIIFSSINFAGISPCSTENVRENDLSNIEIGYAETSAAYLASFEAILCALAINHPPNRNSLAVRNTASSVVQKVIDHYFMAINSTLGSNPSEIEIGLQAMEDITIGYLEEVISYTYAGIRDGQKCDAKTAAEIDCNQKETSFYSTEACRAVFRGVRILLAAIFPETQVGCTDSSSSITTAYEDAAYVLYFYLKIIFDSIDLVILNCVQIQAEIPDDSCTASFYQLLESNKVANSTLMLRQVTVFAPTNKAFQKYSDNTEGLVLYHMCNFAQTTDEIEFRTSMTTELGGGPPLWVTRKVVNNRAEVYVNNAKVLMDRSNYQSFIKTENTGGPGERQILHIIDEVLEPVRSNPTASPIYNPDAFQFLNQSENLNLGPHRVRSFRQRVSLTHKEDIFRAEGRYTFFIPVDEGFKPASRSGKVDQKVIDGHVISGHVLFTAPTPNDKAYKTLSFTENIKVTVSFITEQDGKDTRTYVKSNTMAGDNSHVTGVVLAEIVKANIPVRNGVVHLIQRPLMVVDTTVTQFLEDKEDGPVYKFYEAIMDVDKEFMLDITRQREVTLFAPSNAAWDEPSLQPIRQDKKRMLEILKLHYVKERLPLEKIVTNNKKNLQVATAAERKSLYFNIVQGPNGNETITVEGGGVNATVITPNIAATNGIIHIIDRVLGVPYTTIQEKLRTDPMLNSTYFLGQRQGFNNQLNDTKKRFTYFVPRDFAWKAAEIQYPSTYKKLFMPEFAYHAESILQRHVVVADQAYTMAKLREEMHSNDTIILPALRGTLKLRVKESGENNYDDAKEYDENAIRPDRSPGYLVEWQNEWIRVFRPDVECTNGIIHVIDSVLLKDSDVRVTGGSGSLVTFAPHIVMILIAKWLL